MVFFTFFPFCCGMQLEEVVEVGNGQGKVYYY